MTKKAAIKQTLKAYKEQVNILKCVVGSNRFEEVLLYLEEKYLECGICHYLSANKLLADNKQLWLNKYTFSSARWGYITTPPFYCKSTLQIINSMYIRIGVLEQELLIIK